MNNILDSILPKLPLNGVLAAILALTATQAASANPLDLRKDVIVCAKKHSITQVNSYKLVLVQKSRSLIYYESSAGGSQTDECTITMSDKNFLVVQHHDGIHQTITFYGPTRTAAWKETSFPENNENYNYCTSFDSYQPRAIADWLKSIGLVR
jgi:hypothetical protein